MTDYEAMTFEERATVLENAARAMEVRGFCAGTPMDCKGHVCAIGAIALALGWTDEEIQIRYRDGYPLRETTRIYSIRDENAGNIVFYNDTVQDQKKVTARLRERAAQLRAKAGE